jgi:hypothetical protein
MSGRRVAADIADVACQRAAADLADGAPPTRRVAHRTSLTSSVPAPAPRGSPAPLSNPRMLAT